MTQKQKLDSLDSRLRPKVEAVLADLQGKGWQPTIAEARRTIEEQRRKVELGYSRTLDSPHVRGLAADIVDRRYGWRMPEAVLQRYRMHMASSARAHGLTWGGVWTKFYGRNGDWAHVQLDV
jgi:hypothetical protein